MQCTTKTLIKKSEAEWQIMMPRIQPKLIIIIPDIHQNGKKIEIETLQVCKGVI